MSWAGRRTLEAVADITEYLPVHEGKFQFPELCFLKWSEHKAAMLVFQNNETTAMLVSQAKPVLVYN